MKVLCIILLLVLVANCANIFVGSNLYYAAGLYESEQDTLFSGLASAGVKVLRVWLDGESTSTTKGTNIISYPDLEPETIGVYNDTVLELLDEVMVKANTYGIKLLISMHSWNALVRPDVYGQWYGTGYFYEEQQAMDEFDNRLRHILNHNHTTLHKPWKELYNHIFAFEAENEAMIGNGEEYIQQHQYWQCDRAKTIKSELGENSGILVTTGGESWMSESVQPDWLTCPYLDIIAIHGYGTGDYDTNNIKTYVQQAEANGKKLLYQEWGSCYFDTENNDCPTGEPLDSDQRSNNIKTWANQIADAGVPWMYWEILPNPDPHYSYDYEIGINDANWDAFVDAAQSSSQKPSAFDYSEYLLDWN